METAPVEKICARNRYETKHFFAVAFVSDSARQAVLRGELERHSVPYYMVRTKVDQDIANNKEEPWMGQLSQ